MKRIGNLRLLIIIIFVFTFVDNFGQFPDFKYYDIGSTGEMHLGQSSLADLDKDGDLDLIVGASGSSIWWFEFESAEKWTIHKIGDNTLSDKGGVTLDVDRDGNIDQISGGTWYRNPNNKNSVWTRFENGAIVAYDNIAGDINSDGIPELISLSPQEGTFIYFIGDKPEKKWKKIKVGIGVSGGIGPKGLGDMDGDGDIDIVRSNVWFDNLSGDGSKWSEHKTIRFVQSQGEFANSSRVFVIDMDNDKDMDVVQCESNNPKGRIAWLENKDGKGITWFTHPIDLDTQQDLHSLCVADFDNDGDMDVFSGGGPMSADLYKRCFIWENIEKTGEKWLRHEILFKKECINAVAADVDNDGDIDICSKTWKDDKVYYLRNLLIENE
jgi:hypothetical protein